VTQMLSSSHPITAPTHPRDRLNAIDAVHGVTQFGLLVVNVLTGFRVSIFQQFLTEPSFDVNELDQFVKRLQSSDATRL
jgi:uncharacterized protein